jgi:hypothetical protein
MATLLLSISQTTMPDSTDNKKQHYQRLIEIFDAARQRYLDNGGDPNKSSGSLRGNDGLTQAEKKRNLLFSKTSF